MTIDEKKIIREQKIAMLKEELKKIVINSGSLKCPKGDPGIPYVKGIKWTKNNEKVIVQLKCSGCGHGWKIEITIEVELKEHANFQPKFNQ